MKKTDKVIKDRTKKGGTGVSGKLGGSVPIVWGRKNKLNKIKK